MAIRANITLTDGATTPIARVFFPVKSDGDVITWIDRTQAISAGQNHLSVRQRPAQKNAPAYKFDWKLVCPILAELSTSGSAAGYTADPKVAFENIAVLQFVAHERSTQQQRKDILTMMRDLIDEAILTNQMESLDLIW